MSLIRTNLIGWSLGDTFTAAQANAIDLNIINALDKRPGQTDSLGSRVQCAGAGRIVPTFFTAVDANADITVSDGRSIVYLGTTLTADRTYTLKNTGAVPGDTIRFIATNTYMFKSVVKNDEGDVLGIVSAYYGNVGATSDLTAVFDGTQWRSPKPLKNTQVLFNSSATWVCPISGLYMLRMWGGGGGGSGGTNAQNATNSWTCGGGGGGGALLRTEFIQCTEGASYSFTRGEGGAGGGPAAEGQPGGDSSFIGAGVEVYAFGAMGGAPGNGVVTSQDMLVAAAGGSPVRSNEDTRPGWGSITGAFLNMADAAWSLTSFRSGLELAAGGCGSVGNTVSSYGYGASRRGRGNANNIQGGDGGSKGNDAGTYRGGGPGGGGGAGPMQIVTGAAGGGNGGAANASGAGSSGLNGQNAPGNSGWGGGGGGGGGSGSVSGGAGASGGAGGSGAGRLILIR